MHNMYIYIEREREICCIYSYTVYTIYNIYIGCGRLCRRYLTLVAHRQDARIHLPPAFLPFLPQSLPSGVVWPLCDEGGGLRGGGRIGA